MATNTISIHCPKACDAFAINRKLFQYGPSERSPMQHVLIVWELGANLGHLGRLHLTANALVAQGKKVTFAVRNYSAAAPWLAARGWPCVQAPVPEGDWGARVPVGHADWYLCDGFDKPGAAHRLIQQWADVVEKIQPDAMLLDFAPTAIYAAHFLQLPYLVSSVGFCVPPYFDRVACFRPWDATAQGRAEDAHIYLHTIFGTLQRQLGPRAATSLAQLYPPKLVRMCTFAEMDHFEGRAPDTSYLGVLWDDTGLNFKASWQGMGSKKIFCYLNGEADLATPILKTLQKQNYEVIAVAPRLPAQAVLHYATRQCQVLTEPVNVGVLLPHCDAVVTHGGVGLVAQSLCAGVPVFVLAQHAEQALLARRVVQQKMGVATFKATDKALLEQKMQTLLDAQDVRLAAQNFALRYEGFSTQQVAQFSVAVGL
jgi:hypothetical protein